MLMLLASVYVMILLYSAAVLVPLTGIFVCKLMLIWTILMVEHIYKVPVDNDLNNWTGWIHVNVCCL